MAKKQQVMPVPPAWGIRGSFQSLVALLIATLVVAAIYLRQSNERLFQYWTTQKDPAGLSTSTCKLFTGKWVYDNESYPLYKEKECAFMSDQLACEKFGRMDLNYQFWRWQPHHCDLPRFNATALLEKLRNKRLVYVGDSLNRNQWISMVCLVDSVIAPAFRSMHNNGSINIFKATEYNATIEFYWSPLMVESNSDDPVNHRVQDRIVRVQAIEKHARHWTNADFLIFNTYLWWRRRQMKVLWGSFENPESGIYKAVKLPRVYEMALQTWAQWLEVHVNRNKTKLFFMSMSPTHQKAAKWGGIGGKNCYSETELVTEEGYVGDGASPRMMRVVDKVLDELKTRGLNVQMINITQLSDYRKEAHPSIYRKHWETITEEQLANPKNYSDCIHWCLPGVPDVWNELLYAYILQL
ncbi:Protein trichome birefringence-like 34 [Hibiscus syriacus]|uniref:Protein trichome birefringence-like 34 n=1 Tax=Hibiscus syriacus TaxID=106335 RepID=A0A6A3CNS2_HIBSY|nr:protein trichome birefringence-like 34 [Hibiscus syriacus]KAE8728888.1 Protein trichome birefringence-like 34 [Hibiscus syriacus]